MSVRRTPTHVISVRFTDEELERVKDAAARAGLPLSALIRRAALEGPGAAGAVAVQVGSANAPSGGSTSAVFTPGQLNSYDYASRQAVSARYQAGAVKIDS